MKYTTDNENTLYIFGGTYFLPGTTSPVYLSQFSSLDLTSSWNTSNPPWKALQYPTINGTSDENLLLASPSGRKISLWHFSDRRFNPRNPRNSIVDYDVDNVSWTQETSVPIALNGTHGLMGAVNPNTGFVYILGASANNIDYVGGYNSMVIFDPSTGSTSLSVLPTNLTYVMPRYSIVWSQALNAYNGSKILLFGGDTDYAPSYGTISILDVKSMTWSDGEATTDGRTSMACSVSGDNFIVWGGYRNTETSTSGTPSTPLIYNIRTNQWTTQFVRAATATTTAADPGPTNPGGGGGGGGGDGAAIGGGITVAIIVVAIIAYLIMRRRRQQKEYTSSSSNDSETISRHNYDAILPSMENTHGTAALSEVAQTQTGPSGLQSNGNAPAPMILSLPDSAINPSSPQDHSQLHDHQPYHMQERHSPHANISARFDLADASPPSPTMRAPQMIVEPATTASNEEILERINALQAEWIRRQITGSP
ncbi:hypothetical protein BG015_000713 [Linnemannia schmuckeri]|uniref:Galactose oxidase n=1 Tax=Linnemannia schmuckeri TaxID=64567 RepID=A0A9P5RR68_9FUNG|nr:hypothetical protein BG015_000713 [Linnemannia schmuckeri]